MLIHYDQSLIRFFKITSRNETRKVFKCPYCNFEGHSPKSMESHWRGFDMLHNRCRFSLDTCAQFEPTRAKEYRRKYERPGLTKLCLTCICKCLRIPLFLLCAHASMCTFFLLTLTIIVAHVARIVMIPVFFWFYVKLIRVLLMQQLEGLDFTDLFVTIVMPTLNLTLITVSIPMMITITFSMSLSVSRGISMCFKGITQMSKKSRQTLKKIASQRHILKDGNEGKKSAKSAGTEGKCCCTWCMYLLVDEAISIGFRTLIVYRYT